MQRIKASLRGTRGASILFVLAVSLLLMAVGISVLAAGAAALSAGTSREISAQLQLYNDSVQKAIKYAIFNCMDEMPEDDTDIVYLEEVETLGGLLLRQAYLNPNAESVINLSVDSLTGEDEVDQALKDAVQSIEITIEPTVLIEPPVESSWETYTIEEIIDDFIFNIPVGDICITERTPRKATVDAEIKVIVTIEYRGRQMVSTATYLLLNGYLEDENDPKNSPGDIVLYGDDRADLPDEEYPMLIKYSSASGEMEWRLDSYEKTDETGGSEPDPGDEEESE